VVNSSNEGEVRAIRLLEEVRLVIGVISTFEERIDVRRVSV